jgi:hypothetical protein
MSDTEIKKKPAADSERGATPSNSPEKMMSAEDSLIANLMKQPEAPSEDKPKAAESASAQEAATTTDNQGHLDTEEPEEETSEETEAVEDDTEEESEEGEESDDETEASQDSEEEPEEAEEEEVVYTTPDGEEVTLDELKRGWLRQADYTKKTQEVAQARQQVEQAVQALGQHNQVIAEHLSLALNIVEPQLAEFANTNWDELASNDPYEYAESKAKYEQAQVRYQRLQEAAQQTVAQEQQRVAAAKAQMTQQEQQKLQMALPDLADPKAGPKLARSIKDYALSSGLSEKEASNITDHRLVVMLNKARMYDELNQSSLTAAKKKLSKSPKKVARAGQPSSKAEQNSQKKAQVRSRLKQSGSVDDLVALLMS